MKRENFEAPSLGNLPGHLIRRLHQISQGLFHQEVEDYGVTPIQYGVLQTVHNNPNIDQQTLASLVALDTSTTAGVVDRLESKGLVTRSPSPEDRRVRRLQLTKEGQSLLFAIVPGMLQSQELLLAPLTKKQREEFMALLAKLVTANNEYSRAPSRITASAARASGQ